MAPQAAAEVPVNYQADVDAGGVVGLKRPDLRVTLAGISLAGRALSARHPRAGKMLRIHHPEIAPKRQFHFKQNVQM